MTGSNDKDKPQPIGQWGCFGNVLAALIACATTVYISTRQPTPTPVASATPASPLASTASPTPPSTLESNREFVPEPLPRNTCDIVPGMFYMGNADSWYGPFGNGFGLKWIHPGGFYVWNPWSGSNFYPDPYASVQRNTWLRLPNSPFNICVDSLAGNVFGQYSP